MLPHCHSSSRERLLTTYLARPAPSSRADTHLGDAIQTQRADRVDAVLVGEVPSPYLLPSSQEIGAFIVGQAS